MSELDQSWEKIRQAGDNLGVRSLFSFAHQAAKAGSHGKEIAEAYAMAVELQDRDPDSPTYGNYRWYRSNERPQDLNAVEFVTAEGILTWNHHRDDLSGEARNLLEDLLRMNVNGVRGHRVLVTYTNIFIKRTWNCIALGEAFEIPDLAQEGYEAFETWCRYTAENGFHEYLSPTYYSVDLTNLEKIARYAGRSEEREKAERALHHLWMDIGANWYDPADRLGGAHSRDYDYIRGNSERVALRMSNMLEGQASEEGHVMPETVRDAVREVRQTYPRMVCQSWGHESGQTASQYMTETFSLASSCASRHNMDKVLTVNFASGRDTPMMNLIMDGRGDPFGVNPVTEKDGHTKSRHLVPFIARVQRESEVLMLLSAGPETWAPLIAERPKEAANPLQTTGLSFDASGMPSRLLSHLAIPLKAKVSWGSETLVAPDTPQTHSLDLDEIILVEWDGAAVAIRTCHVDTPSGEPGQLALIVDNQGIEHGVMRLTWTHSESEPDGRGSLAVHVAAGTADAAVDLKATVSGATEVSVDGDRIEIAVDGRHGRMRVVADPPANERSVLEGGEQAQGEAVLWVNGRDYGKEIWS